MTFHIGYPVTLCGRTAGGRTDGRSRDYQIFLDAYITVLPMTFPCARFASFFYIDVSFPFLELVNRPFYRYGGHIELIRFNKYYRMPRGHEHISFVFSSAFRDIFS